MTLDQYRADLPDRARALMGLSPEERRRRAMTWARDRDSVGLCELMEAYRHHFGGGSRSMQTERAYRQGVRLVVESGFTLIRPSMDEGAAFIRELETRVSRATVGPRLAAARWLFAALIWAGVCSINPFEKVRPSRDPTDPASKRQEYSEDEVERLMQAADSAELRVILRLGLHSGLRNMEMVNLDWQDVDFPANEVRVRVGKGGKQRRVPLSPGLRRVLIEFGVRPSGPVLGISESTLRRRIRAVAARAGVQTHGRVTHAMRHSAGVRMVKASSGDLQAVADFLGHASLSTAAIYAKKADQRVKRVLSSWDE